MGDGQGFDWAERRRTLPHLRFGAELEELVRSPAISPPLEEPLDAAPRPISAELRRAPTTPPAASRLDLAAGGAPRAPSPPPPAAARRGGAAARRPRRHLAQSARGGGGGAHARDGVALGHRARLAAQGAALPDAGAQRLVWLHARHATARPATRAVADARHAALWARAAPGGSAAPVAGGAPRQGVRSRPISPHLKRSPPAPSISPDSTRPSRSISLHNLPRSPSICAGTSPRASPGQRAR